MGSKTLFTFHLFFSDNMVCLQQERSAVIRTLGPALAVLAEVVPHLAFADTMAADSPRPSAVPEDIIVVNTSDELLDAINSDGVRHVVIRSHLNVTSPDTSSSAQLRTALLRLPQSTKHIQVFHVCLRSRLFQLVPSCARTAYVRLSRLNHTPKLHILHVSRCACTPG